MSSNGKNTDTYLLAAAESEAQGKYDLPITILHELAHLYGFIDGHVGFDALIDAERLSNHNFTISLDGEHLDREAHPHDLLNTHLARLSPQTTF